MHYALGARTIDQEGRAVVENLGGRWTARGGMCRCPVHNDGTASLSVRPGRSRLLLHCFAGCEAPDILRALHSMRLVQACAAAGDDPTARRSGGSALNGAALRLWRSARTIAGTPAEAYLLRRGIRANSSELRYCPRAPDGPAPGTSFRPALIAAVSDETGIVAVHRTFIGPNIRGRVRRAGLGRFGGGAVRLGGIAARLGLAEGIETALSASLLFGIPCWATLGTERFGQVSVPAGAKELVLFLDNDAGGRRAEELARAAFGHRCNLEASYPTAPGEDWNDVLGRLGPHSRASSEESTTGRMSLE